MTNMQIVKKLHEFSQTTDQSISSIRRNFGNLRTEAVQLKSVLSSAEKYWMEETAKKINKIDKELVAGSITATEANDQKKIERQKLQSNRALKISYDNNIDSVISDVETIINPTLSQLRRREQEATNAYNQSITSYEKTQSYGFFTKILEKVGKATYSIFGGNALLLAKDPNYFAVISEETATKSEGALAHLTTAKNHLKQIAVEIKTLRRKTGAP